MRPGFSLWQRGNAVDLMGHPRLEQCTVRSPGLHSMVSSLQPVFLTDCHTLGMQRLEKEVLTALSSIRPGLLLFGGDFTKSKASRSAVQEVFSSLCQDTPSFGVLGNNDFEYDHGIKALVRILERCNIRILRNDAVLWPTTNPSVAIAGVDDFERASADLDRAFSKVPENVPIILLSHSPRVVNDPRSRRASLILAGHTHAGQIRIPFLLPLFLKLNGYPLTPPGLTKGEGCDLYLSRGVGTTGFQVRFRCPPELTRLVSG